MKYTSILCVALVFVLGGAAGAQEDGTEAKIKKAIDDYLAKSEVIWADGKAANRPLRRAKRKAREVATVINKIRRHVRAIGNLEPAPEKDKVKSDCDEFIASAQALVKFDTAITPCIDAITDPLASEVAGLEKKKNDVEARIEAISGQIAETEGDAKGALEETRRELQAHLAKVDAELMPVKHRHDILEAADETVWRAKAEAILTPFLNQGTYLGMFDDHLDAREKLLEAFLNIFINLDEDTNLRSVAGEGVAQYVRDAERAGVIEKVKATFDLVDEQPTIRTKAMYVLARIGERGPFDAEIKVCKDRIAAEQKKEQPNMNVVIGSYRQLVFHHQGINDFKNTARYNVPVARVITLATPYDRADARQRQNVSFLWYNFACVLSRIEMIEQALYAIEQSFNYGYTNFDWALKDGDLENVRKDDRFATIHAAFKSGERTPGSMTFDDEKFAALMAPLSPQQPGGNGGEAESESETGGDAAGAEETAGGQ